VAYILSTDRNDGGTVSETIGFDCTIDYWIEFSAPLP
jgi:hypothetical protein